MSFAFQSVDHKLWYLNENFHLVMQMVFHPLKQYKRIIRKAVDFIVFNKKPWLGESLINKGLKSVGRGGNMVFKGYLFFHLGYPPKKLVN